MTKYFMLFAMSVFLFSCKTKNIGNTPIGTNNVLASSAAFFSKIKEPSNFQQLKINSKVDIENGTFIPTLDATIYIEKDQKVWINMIAIFLNVGRGIATPEGIKGYEKWNKTYIESDFSYLNKLLNVNFIDFKSFQNLLLGKTFVPINEKDFLLTKNAQGYQLSSSKDLKFETNGKVSEYGLIMEYSPDFNLTQVNFTNKKTTDQLQVSYSNWTDFENLKVPTNVKIIIKGSKTSQILLENTRFEASKMDTPYSVPNNYTKTEIK